MFWIPVAGRAFLNLRCPNRHFELQHYLVNFTAGGAWGGSAPQAKPGPKTRVGMNGDTFSIKAPKECSKKFAATFQGKVLTRGNVLRIFFLFLEDFGVPL